VLLLLSLLQQQQQKLLRDDMDGAAHWAYQLSLTSSRVHVGRVDRLELHLQSVVLHLLANLLEVGEVHAAWNALTTWCI
jgi:hypothetical protein